MNYILRIVNFGPMIKKGLFLYEKLAGFLGGSTPKDIELIRVFVNGISTNCSSLTFP